MDGLDIVLADSRRRHGIPPVSVRERPSAPKRRLRGVLPFLLVVLLPTALAGGYLFGIAADQYVSEARFVVRGTQQQAPSLLSNFLQSTGMSRAEEDTHAVQDYVLSRDALKEVVEREDVRAVFDRPEGDVLSRFPSPLLEFADLRNTPFGNTFEHLFRHYLKHVTVRTDSATGVSELTVTTFRPEDSRRIAAALLAAGERLVNRMNDRQRENALRDARKEVQIAEARVLDVASRIADFRNREALLDPNRQAVPMLQTITTLQTRLNSLKLEIGQMQPNSPLLPGARQRASALQAQIDVERAKITGSDSSLVPKLREFDQLTLEREFADKQLVSVTASLETARMNSDRQQLYLEQIVVPNEPDYALYPKRFVSLAVVFATAMGIYLAGALLVAGAREHRMV